MYAEIRNIKKLMLAQYDKDVHFFCNAINNKKLAIDMKDHTAYTDDSLIQGLFQAFKHDSVPTDFKSEFTSLERSWQMDNESSCHEVLSEILRACWNLLMCNSPRKGH
jgi:hypothetical protein